MAPVTKKISDDGQNEYISFGSSSMQGYRFTQEDAHNCCIDFGENSAYFAVYDGHGGAEVALYCAQKLPHFLKSVEAFRKGDFEEALKDAFITFDSTLVDAAIVEELKKLAAIAPDQLQVSTDEGSDEDSEKLQELLKAIAAYKKRDFEQALKEASDVLESRLVDSVDQCNYLAKNASGEPLANTDKGTDKIYTACPEYDDFEYTIDSDSEAIDVDNLYEESEDEVVSDNDDGDDFLKDSIDVPGQSSGCTAIVALVFGRVLFVANAGDCRCVLSRNGKAVDMSIDQKPQHSVEKLRIKKAGGYVTKDGRVNGVLNVSRTIGDHAFKMNKNFKPEEQAISPMPDVKNVTLQDDDEFMVLASDGIWNCMSSDEVVKFVRERLIEKREKISSISEELFAKCLEPDAHGNVTGCDNMTAIIVQFQKNIQRTDN